MTKVICTTTINPPTEALKKFAAMEDWTLVVAGDLKTPKNFEDKILGEPGFLTTHQPHYLSPNTQESLFPRLSRAIPWNCIQRRNLAFLFAHHHLNADIIATVDDDNIPHENWGKTIHVGNPVQVTEVVTHDGVCFDPLYATDAKKLWHRGFPLEMVRIRGFDSIKPLTLDVHVQANLWLGEPDVDAICRMTHPTELKELKGLFPFCSKSPAPFNSQNTILSREVIPHYFMFPHVGRFDDILAAYHVQTLGYIPVFDEPTVTQLRNPHNVTKDMMNEFWGYEHALDICLDIRDKKNDAVLKRLPKESRLAFDVYQSYF